MRTQNVKRARKLIRFASRAIDHLVILFLVLMLMTGAYAVWDTQQMLTAADAGQYALYRPEPDAPLSFEELRAINPEVIAWLHIDHTGIDYPVLHAADNRKYLSMDAFGKPSGGGSIFLDYRNQPDFTDFNNLLHGHFMAGGRMFGDLARFEQQDFFEQNHTGSLYLDGCEYPLEIVAFIATAASDHSVFCPPLQEREEQEQFLDHLLAIAEFSRDFERDTNDRYLLLSTCNFDETDGRHILLARFQG